MRFIGRREGVADDLVERMDWAEEMTAANDRITLFVAFNYGGRAEIVDAARNFQGDSEEEFRHHLYAPEMHDPDLLIRTSGEQRISNYLLWQCAYSELVFRDELWPRLRSRGVRGVAARVRARQRRFGTRAYHAPGGEGAARARPRARRTSSTTDEPAPGAPDALGRRRRQRRACAARRRGGSSSRSPGSSSRSRSRSPAAPVRDGDGRAIGLLCLRELLRDDRALRPIGTSPPNRDHRALIVAAHFGTAFNVLLVLAASFPVLFVFGADRNVATGSRVDGGHPARHRLDRAAAGSRGASARPARSRRRAPDRRPRRHFRLRHRRLWLRGRRPDHDRGRPRQPDRRLFESMVKRDLAGGHRHLGPSAACSTGSMRSSSRSSSVLPGLVQFVSDLPRSSR